MSKKQEVIVTYLEMRSESELRSLPDETKELLVLHNDLSQWQLNRFFYSWVGANWHWQDRLVWSDAQWQEYAQSDDLHTYIAIHKGSLAGYFELAWLDNEVQIASFGLTPGFIGRGFGALMLTRALEAAWAMQPQRVWLHTCSLDHPAALNNYKARGFRIYKTRSIAS